MVGALIVILSGISGVVTNLVTQAWSWALAVALGLLLAATAALAWHHNDPVRSPETKVRQTARNNSRIEGGRIEAGRGAQVEETARDGATIEDSTIKARGGSVRRRADDSAIRNNNISTTDP